jgi:uncharacterized protein
MAGISYYVYALKDPTRSPAVPFYVGKGTGTRAYDHLGEADQSRRGRRIDAIRASGHEPLVVLLIEELTEIQAIKIEAELISAFGTEDTGGILTNAVIPSGQVRTTKRDVVIPHGAYEKAQLGLALLKDAVLEFSRANGRGVTNAETASALGLRSDYGGGSKDYLSYSVLGLLMREGKISRQRRSNRHVAQVR